MVTKTTKTAKPAKTASAKKAPAKKKEAVKKVAPAKASATKAPVAKKAAPKAAPKAPAKKPVAKGPVKKAPVKKEKAASVSKAVKAPKSTKSSPAKTKESLGVSEQLRAAALKVLDDKKAEDIVSVDLRGRSALADYVIVASGGSARQLGALAEYLREAFFKLGVKKLRIEGLPQGDWVLIDAGDVIVHVFRPEVRRFYQIEDIWSAKTPVGV